MNDTRKRKSTRKVAIDAAITSQKLFSLTDVDKAKAVAIMMAVECAHGWTANVREDEQTKSYAPFIRSSAGDALIFILEDGTYYGVSIFAQDKPKLHAFLNVVATNIGVLSFGAAQTELAVLTKSLAEKSKKAAE
jgi:hypothetical protein